MTPTIRVTLAALLAVTALSRPALSGDSDSVEIGIGGYATPVCKLPAGSQTGGSNMQYTNGALVIDNLLDETNATAKASSGQITFPDVMCNYRATISIMSLNGGMTSDGQTPLIAGDFATKVPYVISGTWGSLTLPPLNTAVTPAGTAVTKEAGGANRGTLVLTVTTENGDTPVIEGQLSDTIVLKLGALI